MQPGDPNKLRSDPVFLDLHADLEYGRSEEDVLLQRRVDSAQPHPQPQWLSRPVSG